MLYTENLTNCLAATTATTTSHIFMKRKMHLNIVFYKVYF